MSTIDVANITDGTDTVATSYVVNGSAKAWVKLDQDNAGSGTPLINSSLNASSLTDVSLGITEVNLTNAMDADDYPVSGAQAANQAGNLITKLSSSSKIYGAFYVNTSAATYPVSDCSQMQLALHGELA